MYSVALLLIAEPSELVAMHWYDPSSSDCTLSTVRVELKVLLLVIRTESLLTCAPLCIQVMVGGGCPDTVQNMVAAWPAAGANVLLGCSVMAGGRGRAMEWMKYGNSGLLSETGNFIEISGVGRCLNLGGLIVIQKYRRWKCWLIDIHDTTFYMFCAVLIAPEQST